MNINGKNKEIYIYLEVIDSLDQYNNEGIDLNNLSKEEKDHIVLLLKQEFVSD